MIEVEGATKRYGSTTVVDDVDLRVERGGITSLIGPNGAGKSTLLSLIGRLVPMDAGVVHVDGLDVTTGSTEELARRLAVLRQENSVGIRLTVRELVGFGRYPYNRGRPTREDADRVEQALEWLGLADLGDRFLDELSGGQRQRAYVAMTLAQDTDYLLLDEPLNNLDMKHAVGMMQLLRDTADHLDRTVVVVVHDVNIASCWSDRIVALRDGRVVHDGTPDEVVRTEVLRDVYDMDIPVQQLRGHPIGLYFR